MMTGCQCGMKYSMVVMEVNDEGEEEIWRRWMIHFMDAWGAAAYDDVGGQALDVEEVKRARAEEMKFVKTFPVYEERDVEECWRKTGKRPITTE